MALIVIPDEDVRRLEGLAPSYLRGERKGSQRVRWAIQELEKRITPDDIQARREQAQETKQPEAPAGESVAQAAQH